MKYTLRYTGEFKRSLKRCLKRGYDENLLSEVLSLSFLQEVVCQKSIVPIYSMAYLKDIRNVTLLQIGYLFGTKTTRN